MGLLDRDAGLGCVAKDRGALVRAVESAVVKPFDANLLAGEVGKPRRARKQVRGSSCGGESLSVARIPPREGRVDSRFWRCACCPSAVCEEEDGAAASGIHLSGACLASGKHYG